jgi:hypothetical protein
MSLHGQVIREREQPTHLQLERHDKKGQGQLALPFAFFYVIKLQASWTINVFPAVVALASWLSYLETCTVKPSILALNA